MTEGWELLEIVGTEEDAELVAGYLRSEGVDCRVESDHSHEFPVNINKLGDVSLLVHPEDIDRARQLIEERETTELPTGLDSESAGDQGD